MSWLLASSPVLSRPFSIRFLMSVRSLVYSLLERVLGVSILGETWVVAFFGVDFLEVSVNLGLQSNRWFF